MKPQCTLIKFEQYKEYSRLFNKETTWDIHDQTTISPPAFDKERQFVLYINKKIRKLHTIS